MLGVYLSVTVFSALFGAVYELFSHGVYSYCMIYAFAFPLLLGDIPAISIKAYSLETVVAEKFHAMIDRDVTNSRMKDFFDCYQILTTKKLDDEGLFEAIKATFDNRGLIRNDDLRLFSNEFYTDGARLLRWKAFMKKIQWKEELAFAEVMRVITTRLEPMYNKYWKG